MCSRIGKIFARWHLAIAITSLYYVLMFVDRLIRLLEKG